MSIPSPPEKRKGIEGVALHDRHVWEENWKACCVDRDDKIETSK
jgi:hypothetical protein